MPRRLKLDNNEFQYYTDITNCVYLLMMTLETPIIGLIDDYYKIGKPYKPPIYKSVVVFKYGLITDSNLEERVEKYKNEDNAKNINVLCIVKPTNIDINVNNLEKDFQRLINTETPYSLSIATHEESNTKNYKVGKEWVTVSFGLFNRFIEFFSGENSRIIHINEKFQNIDSTVEFDDTIDRLVKDTDLILNTNINNLNSNEITYIKELNVNDYGKDVNYYSKNELDDFKELIY